MSKSIRTTTTKYKFNAKHGGYQPTDMTVVYTEDVDVEAEAAKQKAQQDALQKMRASVEKDEEGK